MGDEYFVRRVRLACHTTVVSLEIAGDHRDIISAWGVTLFVIFFSLYIYGKSKCKGCVACVVAL